MSYLQRNIFCPTDGIIFEFQERHICALASTCTKLLYILLVQAEKLLWKSMVGPNFSVYSAGYPRTSSTKEEKGEKAKEERTTSIEIGTLTPQSCIVQE